MTETPEPPRPAHTYAEVEDALLSRWPETKLEPSLDRIRAFTELLGAGIVLVGLSFTVGLTAPRRRRRAAQCASPVASPAPQPSSP